MCGIAFVINYGKKIMDIKFLERLFINLSIRRTDSSGYYCERIEDEKIAKRMIKAPMESSKLLDKIKLYEPKDKAYGSQLNGKESLIMFHCRQKTRGTEYDNKNNMPIWSKNYVLIHNGIISNDKLDGYKYSAEVDSEEILARIETYGLVKGINGCLGSMAIAIKPVKNRILYVYRNTNPLDLVYIHKHDILVGCSNGDYSQYEEFDHSKLLETLTSPIQTVVELPPKNLFCISLTRNKIKHIADLSVPSNPTVFEGCND